VSLRPTGFPRILENGKYSGISFYTFPVGKCPWKLKKWSKSGIYPGNLYWKCNFLTTGSFDAICQFRVISLGPIINSSLALFVPIVIKASTIGQKKGRKDELITWIWICNVFVEVVQVNVTWISSDDGDQYSITREEIHDNYRILVQAANPKVQHKYSQKHYHKILICKYLTQSMFLKHYLKTTWGEQCNLLYYSSL
jgi:hypothetical protein